MEDGISLQISKLEAARRQLLIAIRMWFYDECPVSTHTLAYAAYEIAHTVSKVKKPNRKTLLLDSDQIRPDKVKEFHKAFREAANFFKHADKDPHGSIQFIPSTTELFIYYAIHGLQQAGVTIEPEFMIFWFWVQIHRSPEPGISKNAQVSLKESFGIEDIIKAKAMDKDEFFERCAYALKSERSSAIVGRRSIAY